MRYCNYWGLVVPDKNIVKDGELPESWGMYVAQKNRLKCVVPCPKLDPVPMSITMLTALAYAINQRGIRADEAALNKARDEGYEQGSGEHRMHIGKRNTKHCIDKVDEFEKASGLNIQYGWHKPEKIGDIVKLFLDGNAPLKRILDTAKYNLSKTEDLKKEIEKQIMVLESALSIPQRGGGRRLIRFIDLGKQYPPSKTILNGRVSFASTTRSALVYSSRRAKRFRLLSPTSSTRWTKTKIQLM